jgi:hypothetical protein
MLCSLSSSKRAIAIIAQGLPSATGVGYNK